MKFIVSSSQLLKQLQSISGVLNSSNTLPILDNFLFEVKSNELIVSASDLETTMTTQINNTEASEEGNIAIPAKLLMDTLKTFSEQPLTFLVDKSTRVLKLDLTMENISLRVKMEKNFLLHPAWKTPLVQHYLPIFWQKQSIKHFLQLEMTS